MIMKEIGRRLRGLNNKLNYNNKQIQNFHKRKDSYKLSIIAILISFISVLILGANLYLQFLHKSHKIQIALSQIDVEGDSIIKSRLLLSNIGNQYVTINNCRFFYSKNNSCEDFILNRPINEHDKALVLRPSEQSFFEIEQSLVLDGLFWHILGTENDTFIRETDEIYVNIYNDTIVNHNLYLFLEVEFYNQEGILSQHYEEIGSITFERKLESFDARIRGLNYKTLTFLAKDMCSEENTITSVLNGSDLN